MAGKPNERPDACALSWARVADSALRQAARHEKALAASAAAVRAAAQSASSSRRAAAAITGRLRVQIGRAHV